jgi:hypothetical protein
MNKHTHVIFFAIRMLFLVVLLTGCGAHNQNVRKSVVIQNELEIFYPPQKFLPRPSIKLECPECAFELEAPPMPAVFIHYYIIR